VLVIGWMTFYQVIEGQPSFLRNPLHANMTIVIGTLTIFLVGLLASRFFGGSNDARPANGGQQGDR
jgi:SSS family solute:Na+ symporter